MGCDIHGFIRCRKENEWIDRFDIEVCRDRNYTFFGCLAGVRNYDVVSLAVNRGLPEGIKLNEVDEYKGKWLGDHSHSYCSLKELLDHDWSDGTEERIFVELCTYKEWKKSGEKFPSEWCGGVGGSSVVIIQERQVATSESDPDGRKMIYVDTILKSTLRDRIFGYIEWIEGLKKIADDENINYEDMQFVFGFDS